MSIINIKIDSENEKDFIKYLKRQKKYNIQINEDIEMTDEELQEYDNDIREMLENMEGHSDDVDEKLILKLNELREMFEVQGDDIDLVGEVKKMIENLSEFDETIIEDLEDELDSEFYIIDKGEGEYDFLDYVLEIGELEEGESFQMMMIHFENGRVFSGYCIDLEEIKEFVKSDSYYFSNAIVLSEINEKNVRIAIQDLMERDEFYSVFEEWDEDIEESPFHPIRMN